MDKVLFYSGLGIILSSVILGVIVGYSIGVAYG